MSALDDLLGAGAIPGMGPIYQSLGQNALKVPPQAQQAPPQAKQPSKLGSLLGMLGDAMLVAHGQAPAYQNRLRDQQAQSALSGFLTNPDQAIAQLMQVQGQAANGIDLYKAVHPPSETPLEIKLLQHLKDHPEDGPLLHQINVDTHPGLGTPVSLPEGASVQTPGTIPHVTDQASYDAVPPGTPYITPDGHVRQKPGGATASAPSPTFPRPRG